ncbi:hypothetical protein [Limosilactobacillus secaliphilus]|uniref:Uncharacterized protein n=1 Tax=Limosilactobacillus secaliphilus TaxID=396268 RepID=A0A0R2IAH1_9LACO|nr:hypothetical protein [Limosilactobacillus secaliphilus]KRN59127.1 hypothetical protein IV45_GL000164 [Limosilactobacillus secaliphilus]
MTEQKDTTLTSNKVLSLSQSIKSGLTIGEKYVSLLNQLASTTEADELLDAMKQLAAIDLTSPFVKFPQHYETADYYLLFMDRLLELNQVEGISVQEEDDHSLSMQLANFGDKISFKFELDQKQGGAFFAEQDDHEPLFYINLEKTALRFSNRALVNFFIVREIKHYSDLDLAAAVKPLISFAHVLKDQLHFHIDLGILDTENDFLARLAQPELDLKVIDKLFVETADSDYRLLNLPHNNGASLQLDRQVHIELGFDPDDYSQQWSFRVVDDDSAVSFFDVLLHYKLIRDWYLDNRDALAVRSDPLIFAD